MNKLTLTLVGVLAVSLAGLSACSKKAEEPQTMAPVVTATPAPVVQQLIPEQAAAPMAQQANVMPQAGGGMPMQQMNSGGSSGGEGKILQSMHASSYTYMQVESKGKQVWIATNAMQVKTGDTVRWRDGALMKNFTSTALHRTFDEILFVSAAEVAK